MTLNGPNTDGEIAGLQVNGLAPGECSARQRSGYDRADPGETEGAVYKQSRFADIARPIRACQLGCEFLFQLLYSLARTSGSRNDRGVSIRGKLKPLFDIGAHSIGLTEIAFAERDHHSSDAEVNQNLQVFLGLRHPSVVSRDHQESQIDRAYAGDHVPNKVFVAGYVHHPDMNPGSIRCLEIKVGKTEIDRNLSRFFFR